MEKVLKNIQSNNWKALLKEAEASDATTRKQTRDFLLTLNVDEGLNQIKLSDATRKAYYKNREVLLSMLNYAILIYSRTPKEIKEQKTQGALESIFRKPAIDHEALLTFFQKHPPTYLEKFLIQLVSNSWSTPDFKIVWKLYQQGTIPFNEALFVNSLLTVPMFDRSTMEDAQFLIDNPAALDKVFLKFYKQETPILDISKWQGRKEYECAKVTKYWTEVIDILQEKGIEMPRALIENLLSTLNYNWKKPHINWHIQIIKKLKPTKEEYLAQQHYLATALHSENNTVVNFVISVFSGIYKADEFEVDGFMQNLDSLFVKEKMDKSIQKALKIVDYFMSFDRNTKVQYAESLAIGLSQTNTDTQALFANLLLKHLPKEKLVTVIEPYLSVLKPKAKDIFKIAETSAAPLPTIEKRTFTALKTPDNWTDLMYHIGLCIKNKSAKDIELFLEGLNQLQEEIPTDFEKQIHPYTKQLFKRSWDDFAMINFTEFFENWVADNKTYRKTEKWKWEETRLPFLRHKCSLLHHKLQAKNNKLPFLSTPTHEPFYVHPDILIDKLLQYEAEKIEIDLEDLIIACNRLLPMEVDATTMTKAKKLKGLHRFAIGYLLGVSEEMEVHEKYLPLWTQVVRSKHPDKNFPSFGKYKAGKYPSVIAPYYPKFTITKDSMWYRLHLENNFNIGRWENEGVALEAQNLFTYTFPFSLAHREGIYYQMTLVPNYIDTCLCRYIPDTASYNEVTEMEYCQYPLQFLLENQIVVHHGGWIYIAQCLIFEKRISRDLAREYLLFAIANKTMNEAYFVEVLAGMMVQKYAPVNRLMESFEEPDIPIELKRLYHKIAKKCIEKVKPKAKPRSFSKIEKSCQEFEKSMS